MSRIPSDASPDARREEAVARRLSEAFERLAASDRGQCLEAEQIAAYQQRTLAPDEAEQCEAHFAGCSRCREVLGLLAAAEDAAMADRQAAAAAAAKPARSRAWRLLWLAPAAAAASVALWLMVQPFSRTMMRAPQSSTPPLVAEAPPPEQLTAPNQPLGPASGIEAPAPPVRRDESPTAVPPPAALGGIAVLAPGNSAGNSGSAASAAKSDVAPTPVAPSASESANASTNASTNANVAEQGQAQAATPSPVAVPPAPSTESAANSAPTPPQAAAPPVQAMSRAAVPLAAPQASAGATAAAPPLGNAAGLFGARGLNVFAVTLRSPTGAVFWRAGAGGRIERSVDAGRTWQTQGSPFTEDWLAGSAVSDTVCWLVGRNGAIARTTDGEHWLRVAPPPAADAVSGKPPDWSSITVVGATTVVVGSATGKKFITRDAGNTWQPQP